MIKLAYESVGWAKAGPTNLDALNESREWCHYKKNLQKMIRLREMNGKTIKYFSWHCARRTHVFLKSEPICSKLGSMFQSLGFTRQV